MSQEQLIATLTLENTLLRAQLNTAEGLTIKQEISTLELLEYALNVITDSHWYEFKIPFILSDDSVEDLQERYQESGLVVTVKDPEGEFDLIEY